MTTTCHNELLNCSLQLVVEKPLFLKLRVIAQHQICLTEENLACEFCIFVKLDNARRVAWVNTDNTVEGHNRVRPQDKVLRIAFLRLVRIVHHVLLMHD